jgi:hypothetical protein
MMLRTKRTQASAVALATMAGCFFRSAEARADDPSRRFDSPQHFALELRFSPYSPVIDEEPALAGRTPYNSTFGDGDRVLVGLEFDWQVLRIPHFGTLGPGLSASYTTMSSFAKLRSTGKPSAEETKLQIWPIYGLAVLRIDALPRELRIPVVPYGKAGVGWAGWRASGPNGTASASGAEGKGQSWGTHFAAGVALQLDVFERSAARGLDEATGINHTYLFGEYYWSNLDGFGSNKALRVGDRTFAFGLAFEF